MTHALVPCLVALWVLGFGDPAAAGLSADSAGWDSGLLTTGESYKRQLSAEGTYTYRDSANPDATATIIVKQTVPVSTAKTIFLPLIAR